MTTDPVTISPLAPPIPPGEDALPYDFGEPMESHSHRIQMNLLIGPLYRHFPDREDLFAAGNMAIYFSETQVKRNDFRGPDFFAVTGTTRRSRKSWVVWGEDGRTPDVVVEVLSASTEAEDRGPKKRAYERLLRVPDYFLYDLETGEVEGFRLEGGRYRRSEPDGRGLWPCLLGLRLGVWRGRVEEIEGIWLRWHTEDGAPVPTDREAAEAETARAEAAAARAEAAAARAEAETARASEAERRLAAYEARFGPLSGADDSD